MAIVALIVAIVSALGTVAGAVMSRRAASAAQQSADASDKSATAAVRSAEAAKAQADAALMQAQAQQRQLAIEEEHNHEAKTPVLVGVVKASPAPTRPGVTTYRLEVQVKTRQPLQSVTLELPVDSWVAPSGVGVIRMARLLSHPQPGRRAELIRPGKPAWWAVAVDGEPSGSVTATAKCRDEYGEEWDHVEVPISMEAVPPA